MAHELIFHSFRVHTRVHHPTLTSSSTKEVHKAEPSQYFRGPHGTAWLNPELGKICRHGYTSSTWSTTIFRGYFTTKFPQEENTRFHSPCVNTAFNMDCVDPPHKPRNDDSLNSHATGGAEATIDETSTVRTNTGGPQKRRGGRDITTTPATGREVLRSGQRPERHQGKDSGEQTLREGADHANLTTEQQPDLPQQTSPGTPTSRAQ